MELLGAAGALMVVSRVGFDAAYVLSDAPRDSLFAANREGLASAPGYAALFFMAAAFMSHDRVARFPQVTQPFVLSFTAVMWLVCAWIMAVTSGHGAPSRRVADGAGGGGRRALLGVVPRRAVLVEVVGTARAAAVLGSLLHI